jgi:hypothetical protein
MEKADMKTLSLHNLATPQGAVENKALSTGIVRDIMRVVTMAVFAGTAFALLLAVTALSLTIIAPPAHASGSPVTVIDMPTDGGGIGVATSGNKIDMPTDGGGIGEATSGNEDATPMQLADATPQPQAKPTQPPQVAVHEQVYESREKTKPPVVLYVVLALLAGLLGYFGYTVLKGKS